MSGRSLRRRGQRQPPTWRARRSFGGLMTSRPSRGTHSRQPPSRVGRRSGRPRTRPHACQRAVASCRSSAVNRGMAGRSSAGNRPTAMRNALGPLAGAICTDTPRKRAIGSRVMLSRNGPARRTINTERRPIVTASSRAKTRAKTPAGFSAKHAGRRNGSGASAPNRHRHHGARPSETLLTLRP